jgi:hypothetical protein
MKRDPFACLMGDNSGKTYILESNGKLASLDNVHFKK